MGLGLFAAAGLAQCQPACTPIEEPPAPPVEVPVEVPPPPVTEAPTTTTAAPFVPTFDVAIVPNDDCSALDIDNRGTGTVEVVAFDPETHLLLADYDNTVGGDSVEIPWTVATNGLVAVLIQITAVTPGNPTYPAGYLLHDGMIRQDQSCPELYAFSSEVMGDVSDGPNGTCDLTVGWTGNAPESWTNVEVTIDVTSLEGWSKTGIVHDFGRIPMTSEHWFVVHEAQWAPPAGTNIPLENLALRASFSYSGPTHQSTTHDEMAFASLTVSAVGCLA